MIFAEDVCKKLKNTAISVQVYDLIDSTNAEAKRLVLGGVRKPRLLVAREQSAGRGRLGRQFLSRREQGLFFSLLYFTQEALADAVSVTTAAATVTALAIERATGASMRIKWVNDIYNECGKVCGILAETLPVDGGFAVVVGIGINVGKDDFPPELQGIASSIGDVDGKEAGLVAEIADELLAHGEHPTDRSYMQAYRERFLLAGAEVNLLVGGEVIDSGIVLGVTDDGGLILKNRDGEIKMVHSGEVSVRKREKLGIRS